MSPSFSESGGVPADHRVNDLLEECLSQAKALAHAIHSGMNQGKVPAEKVAQLQELVQRIIRLAPADLSETTRQALTTLFGSLQSAQEDGAAWMDTVGLPELELLARARKGASIYRRRSQPDRPAYGSER